MLDIETNHIFISRNVVFYESVFPFSKDSSVSDIFQRNLLPLPILESIFPATFDISHESDLHHDISSHFDTHNGDSSDDSFHYTFGTSSSSSDSPDNSPSSSSTSIDSSQPFILIPSHPA